MHNTIPQSDSLPDASLCVSQPSILERVARGNPRAFGEVVHQYGRFVTYLVRRSIGARHADFDDAVQDVLLAIWRAAPHFDRRLGSETTFVAMISRRTLIDRMRKAAARPKSVAFNHEWRDEAGGWERDNENEDLRAAMERLKPSQREILELAVTHGKTGAQIARITGLPLGTVKSSMARVLTQLRDELGRRRAAA